MVRTKVSDMQELTRRAGAGAALVTAMYYAPADWMKGMPDQVAHAYMWACEQYGVAIGPATSPCRCSRPSESLRLPTSSKGNR